MLHQRPVEQSKAGGLNIPPTQWGLYSDLRAILHKIYEEQSAEKVLILPLSWRNPEVVSIATAGAIWQYCYFIATMFGFAKQPPDRFLERLMRICDQRTEAEKEKDARTVSEFRRRAFQDLQRIKHFTFVDLDDPSPFIAAMENHENRLVKVLEPKIGQASWDLAPFSRAQE